MIAHCLPELAVLPARNRSIACRLAALCLPTPLAIWLLFKGMRFDYPGGWCGVVGWRGRGSAPNGMRAGVELHGTYGCYR